MENIAIIATIVFVVFALITIYILFKRVTFTRERYAFFSTGLLFSFGIIVLTHIFADESFIIIISSLLNKYIGLNLTIPTTDWTGKILSVFVLLIIAIFNDSIFKNWAGARSELDNELHEKHKNMKYLDAAIKGAIPFNITIINKKEQNDNNKIHTDIEYIDNSKSWDIEAKEILKLISPQYKFTEDDWHSEYSLYISKYSQNDIAIYTTLYEPKEEELVSKINFLKEYFQNKSFIKLIVMIKYGNSDCLTKEIEKFNIEFKYENQLLDSLINFDEYFDFIKNEFKNKEITSGVPLTLNDIYVLPKGKILNTKLQNSNEQDKFINNLELYLLKWVQDSESNKHISLLGEYGQGKSVLSLKLAYKLINKKNVRIPIIIELRGKSPKNETLLDIIASWASRFNISPKAVEKLLYAGKLLIILEGFDEMDLIGDSHTRHLHFKRLLEFMRFKKSKVIITGRPNLFLNNTEMEIFLQLDKNNNQTFYTEPIHIEHLNKQQIIEALRNVEKSTRDDIQKLLNNKTNNSSFIDLISRPSTLYQTSVIWNNLDKSNINSSSVINQFIKYSYRRQEEKLRTIGNTGVSPILTVDEREYFMIGIAVGMLKHNQYSNQINKLSLEKIIVNLYHNIPNEVSRNDENATPLKNRLKDNKQYLETVFNDVRTSGILVKDLSKHDSFKFAHKSFLEFLFALYFTNSILENDTYYTKIVNSISNALDIENIYNFKFSEEVIEFISTLLVNNLHTKKDKLCDNFLNIILPFQLISKYSSNILRKRFRYFLFITNISSLSILLYGFGITNKAINLPIYILIILALSFIITYYILRVTSPSKLKKPIRIWHKTCKYNTTDDEIYNTINSEYLELILNDKPEELSLSIKRIINQLF